MELKERAGGKPSGASRVDEYLPRSSINALGDAMRAELLLTQTPKQAAKAKIEVLHGGCLLYRLPTNR